jgi:toxin YoeB
VILVFDPDALKDVRHWVANGRRRALKAIDLIDDVLKSPFTALGKPEPLRHDLGGNWLQRIDQKYRLVDRIDRNAVVILAYRYHYA